ncbi:hypothetical protein BDV12DRAFT_201815 [Aspergillus spectabilis]
MASITCHRHLSASYDHYGSQAGNNHNTSPSLHLAASTLAATPLYPNTVHEPSSSLAVPSLDIPSATAVDKTHPCHSFDLTGGVYILSATSDSVNHTNAAQDGMVDTPEPPSSDGLRTPKRKRTVSPSSTNSPGEIRSTSRSTYRSRGYSRQSSPHSHRRTNTTTSLTPSAPDSPIRRENLLALHRESCRLFQDYSVTKPSSPPQTPTRTRRIRTFSELSSPPVTPILEHRHSTLYHTQSDTSHQTVPVQHVEVTSTAEMKPTIIEWTSPSTRRREYEAIDRASRGVRGFWRRVAPRWCQFGDSRVPFFEEGKDGKANYEGSVRRFRMDLPDEPSEGQSQRGYKIKRKSVVHAIGRTRRSKTGLL